MDVTMVEIGGGRSLAVRDTGGDGQILLFVHGIMMDGSVWDAQVAAFRATHRCVRVDLRGHGASPAEDPTIAFEDHADDLAALIRAMDLRGVAWAGWSMGGAIAMVFGPRHPGLIEWLVLMDATPQLLAGPDDPRALPPEAAMGVGGLLASDVAAGAFAGLRAPEDKTVRARLAAVGAAARADVTMAAFQSSGARHQIEEPARIDVPTAILHGREDADCLPAAAEFMAARIPGAATVAWIEGAGHAPFLTRPDAFAEALRGALG